MSPSAERTQCPFCLARVRVKGDGTMYAHDWGRPGRAKRCPGSGLTKAEAKAAKRTGGIPVGIEAPETSEARPEDLF